MEPVDKKLEVNIILLELSLKEMEKSYADLKCLQEESSDVMVLYQLMVLEAELIFEINESKKLIQELISKRK
jgi:hypothetical protein